MSEAFAIAMTHLENKSLTERICCFFFFFFFFLSPFILTEVAEATRGGMAAGGCQQTIPRVINSLWVPERKFSQAPHLTRDAPPLRAEGRGGPAASSGGPDATPDPGPPDTVPIAAPWLVTGADGSTDKRKIVNKWDFLKRGCGKGTEMSLGAATLQKGSGRSILQLQLVKGAVSGGSLPSLV